MNIDNNLIYYKGFDKSATKSDSLFSKAVSNWEKDCKSEAMIYFQHSFDESILPEDTMFDIFNYLISQDYFDKAMNFLIKNTELLQDSIDVWYTIIKNMLSMENPKEVIKLTQKALELFPDKNNFRIFMAIALYYLKNYNKALSLFIQLFQTKSCQKFFRYENESILFKDIFELERNPKIPNTEKELFILFSYIFNKDADYFWEEYYELDNELTLKVCNALIKNNLSCSCMRFCTKFADNLIFSDWFALWASSLLGDNIQARKYLKNIDLDETWKTFLMFGENNYELFFDNFFGGDSRVSSEIFYEIIISLFKISKSEESGYFNIEDYMDDNGEDNIDDVRYKQLIKKRNILIKITDRLIRNRITIGIELKELYSMLDLRIRKDINDQINGIITTIRTQERNRIMANLSHTVKNMIGTIIDPLENMKTSNELQPVAIDNAIRGANLVRSLVNAMNLSFKGTIDDFIYDIKNSGYKDATSIKQLFIESLKNSISSMFDGKYFNKFMRNYFPNKPVFIEAKNKWNEISQSTDLHRLESFMNKFMLKFEIDIEIAKDFVIGNDKGSSLKLLILIQEIILNAIKYSSFVPQESRNIKIEFDANKANVSIKVVNHYKPKVQVKSSGLGQEIIKNFSNLLNTKPVIKTDDETYSVEVKFDNLWRNE
ncbi:MAG: hypothetical protein HQ534_02565 [Armatimonadetes bacterium]|nr:hypothetical protein [Armatimonadota bacterium]